MANKRERDLRNLGFLPFEVIELQKMPPNVPYFKELIHQRKQLLRDSLIKKKMSMTQFNEMILNMYNKNNWFRKGKRDPWQLLKKFEKIYKARHPEWTSPSMKNAKHNPIKNFNYHYNLSVKNA